MGNVDVLAQLVALAGLLGATAEYCEIVKRRSVRRRRAVDEALAAEAGLRGMVRVLLTEPDHR
jgi:hypothetical protein